MQVDNASPRTRAPGRPHLAGLVLAVLGCAALASATAYKVVSKPGRHVPPVSARLRALPPPSGTSDETTEPTPPSDAAPSARPAVTPAATPASEDAKTTKATKAAKATSAAKASKTIKTTQSAKAGKAKSSKAKSAKTTSAKAKAGDGNATKAKATEAGTASAAGAGASQLGPPPTRSEIDACINQRRSMIRRCATQAAATGESPWGTVRATLNPDGSISNLRVPGGGYFAQCTARALSGLRCRAYRGSPMEISYPIR